MKSFQKSIIFDRDNTLIKDYGYTHKIEHLRWSISIILNQCIITIENNRFLETFHRRSQSLVSS